MKTSVYNQYGDQNNKFYKDTSKRTFEVRTKDKSWTPDISMFKSSIHEQYKNDQENPLYLALMAEEERVKKAKTFVRTTPQESFADNQYDPLYSPVYSRI